MHWHKDALPTGYWCQGLRTHYKQGTLLPVCDSGPGPVLGCTSSTLYPHWPGQLSAGAALLCVREALHSGQWVLIQATRDIPSFQGEQAHEHYTSHVAKEAVCT